MKKLIPLAALSVLLTVPSMGYAQEEKDLPSQQTKEALDKFKKATSLPGKTLDALRQAGRAKLEGAPGAKAPGKAAADSLALPEKKPAPPESPRYSPAGKRDPFQPLALRPTKAARPTRDPRTLSPLERYDLSQLKLVAIIWNIKEPRAMVEDSGGLGFIVKVGSAIGSNEGKVKAIKPTEVLIEEFFTDIYGERKSRQVPLRLPAE